MTALRPISTFDLLTESWVPVRRLDGVDEEVSLLDVYRRAHQLEAVVGELPTTAFALTRLLVGVLYRVFEVDDPVQVWAALWQQETLPAEDIEDYLNEYADRFDLLHPRTPFYQVAELASAKNETKSLDSLIADVPNNEKFFTTRAGAGTERVPYAEAARWLVHAMAFDPSGIKTGALGDSRVKGGKGYPIGTAWAGMLGGILIEGRTLRETLLLNTVLAKDEQGTPWPEDDLPVWERPPLGAAEEVTGGRPPTGPADLMTWQSRRLRLVGDGAGVTGVVLCNGDQLGPQNRTDEPMTTWRRSPTQEKARKEALVYMPRTHDPERSMWRGLAALLPQGTRGTQRQQGASVAPAGNIEWVAYLRNREVLAPDHLLRTRAVGIAYGPQSSTVAEVIDDVLSMRVCLVADEDLRRAALLAVQSADQAVAALAHLASDLAVAGGGEGTSVTARAREQGFFALDAPFRGWVTELTTETDVDLALRTWFTLARRTLSELGHEQVDASGPTAWVGRTDRNGRHISTPEADARFRVALRKALPTDPPADVAAVMASEGAST